ncbi:VOC family protein [Haloferax namakaokahaiae]|uniref:VOC family protein n=1 Tax=Haloferax namakaokahaiae TaxID=1748331 RepID=A0ABD5ZJC0_9EURY
MPLAHHVGLTVSDRTDSLKFYRDILDFEVVNELSFEGGAFGTAVGVPDASAEFSVLDAGEFRLELIEYQDPISHAEHPRLNQPGTNHLGITVEDLDAFLANVPSNVPQLSEPQVTPTGNCIVFLRDPDGNLIELLER